MVIILVAVMFAALVGMIVCNKKQDVVPVAKVAAMGLMLVVLVCAVLLMREFNVFGGAQQKAIERESHYYYSQAFVAGDYIKEKLGGGKVLILADNGYDKDPRMNEFVNQLKKGMGGGDVVVDTVIVPRMDPNMPEPLSEVMTSKDFDTAVDKHSDVKVIVSLIGLPRDVRNLKALKSAMDKKGPVLFLVGYYGEGTGMGRAIQAGGIAAMITASPTAVYDESNPPRNMQDAFKVRFVLIDKDNLAEYANLFPN